MNDRTKTALDSFRDTLERNGTGFTHTAPTQENCAQIRFIGSFNGRPVIWDATIVTLDHHYATCSSNERAHPDSQFIEVDEGEGDIRKIRIGLQLDCIDEQAILKTIIMIRKYKRLHTGRHEFGYTSLVR
jgi:hypothetical protein